MKILVTGRGGSGSWAIRGQQIGQALGATIKPHATLADMRAADVVLVVKRVPPALLADLRRSRRPWVYDIVDAYPQPECSAWSRPQAVAWARAHLQALQPHAVIWPTRQMADDCAFPLPGAVVYHHARPGAPVNPVRDRLEAIGYEGAPEYLEGWLPALESAARKIGGMVHINPPCLAAVDVVVALRGGRWTGYAQQHWKSNVKLANAHATGTPFVGVPDAGYLETATGRECWVREPADVDAVLRSLQPVHARQAICRAFRPAAIELRTAAAQVREVLQCAVNC